MFAPYLRDLHDPYIDIRGEVAISRADLAGQQVQGDSGYAFHPSMDGVANLYNQNRIALISNTGNLRQPITRQQYLNRELTPRLFLNIFLHMMFNKRHGKQIAHQKYLLRTDGVDFLPIV